MPDIWKPITGYDYEVNAAGQVRRIGGKILSPYIHKRGRGYLAVQLYKGGKRKRYYVHLLVAAAYLPNPNNLPIVNHKDGDTLNPAADNLEWTSVAGNTLHAYEAGLNSASTRCELIAPDGNRETYHSMRALSRRLGKSARWLRVMSGRKGKSFYHNGYKIRVVET